MLQIRASDSKVSTDHKYCVERSDRNNEGQCLAGFSTFNDALAAIYLVQRIVRETAASVDSLETR